MPLPLLLKVTEPLATMMPVRRVLLLAYPAKVPMLLMSRPVTLAFSNRTSCKMAPLSCENKPVLPPLD